MGEPTQNWPHHDPRVAWKPVARNRDRPQSGRWLEEPRTETHVRTAVIVMEPPDAKDPSQVVFPARNQEIQTLAA